MADWVPISDPNDPRLKDTPSNKAPEFDPEAYLKSQEPQAKVEDYKPSRTTYYYPETPEATRQAGLSYKMEGGIHGNGQFSELDLRNHTKEKYLAGESPWVAAAMSGTPTGKVYNMIIDGTPMKVKHVDIGGAIGPGHVDIATSNPDLARGGGEGADTNQVPNVVHRPLTDAEIENLMPSSQDKTEEQQVPTTQQIPQSSPAQLPEIPPTSQFPMAQIETTPISAPPSIPATPTPDFQGMIAAQPQESLLAGPPTAGAMQAATFDPGAYLASQTTPTPPPSPTPMAFDPNTYIASQTSRSEIPSSFPQRPSWMQNAVQAAKEVGMEMLPTSVAKVKDFILGNIPEAGATQDVSNAAGSIADWIGGKSIPDISQQRYGGSQALLQADKTRPFSKERFKVGYQVVAQLAGASALRTQIRAAQMEASGLAKSVGAAPEDAVLQPTSEPPVNQITTPQGTISQFANRFMPEQPGGIGIATKDLVDQGAKMSPEEIAQHVSDVVHNVGGDIVQQAAALRAEEARLSQRSTLLSEKSMRSPSDLEAKIAAQNALNDWLDFKSGPVAKIKTQWSNAGKAMQGEIPIDLGTLNGQIQAWINDVGSAPPPEAIPKLNELAKDIMKASDNRVKTAEKWQDQAANWKTDVTDEMAQARVQELIKKLTPC